MIRRLTTCFLTAAMAAVLLPTANVHADDRDLLRSQGAPPNVLMVIDSSGSMARDVATDSQTFIAGADDPHSKMYQVKSALFQFIGAHPKFNLGFSFYERDKVRINNHLFLYHLAPGQSPFSVSWRYRIDPQGHRTYLGSTTTTFSETNILRLGPDAPATGNHYRFTPLFGPLGKTIHSDWSTRSHGHINVNGTTYTGYYRVDISLQEPNAGTGYYYPAYDWNSSVIQAIDDFEAIHDQYAPVVFNPLSTPQERLDGWNQLLTGRQAVQAVLDANQIGLKDLTVQVDVRNCTGRHAYINWAGQCRRGSWNLVTTITRTLTSAGGMTPQDVNAADTTRGEYPEDMIPNDYNYYATAFDYTNSCNGWQGVFQSATKIPLVPIPRDQDPSLLPYIQSFLRPQPQIQLFFPTRTSGFQYWPHYWDDQPGNGGLDQRGVWVTDRVLYATGATPIKNSLSDSLQYFTQVIFKRNDPLAACRQNFVILLTDGLETCSGANTPCVKATDLGRKGIPVFVVAYGLGTAGNALQCIADNSGGTLYTPNNIVELVDALKKIGEEIEERTRGFASPIVPSVESSTKQMAFISTFTPEDGRSVWQGHLREYKIDPTTGVIEHLRPDGSPDTEFALWDAGDVLAGRSASSRQIFFGKANNGGVPGLRAPFNYPASDSSLDQASRSLLGGEIFYPDVWTDSDTQKVDLWKVASFIRGEKLHNESFTNKDGSTTTVQVGRDPAKYGWCGPSTDINGTVVHCPAANKIEKLGDIFHSQPQIEGSPKCFPCWLSDYGDPSQNKNYRTFLNTHLHRRQVLYVGSNDGLLHAFDAGEWDVDGGTVNGTPVGPQYDPGTGRELFAWAPTGVMSAYDELSFTTDQQWTVDGTPTVTDVFIDPSFTGSPSAADREWRTVLLCGSRRGGRTIVSLDVTEPDPYTGGEPSPSGDITLLDQTQADIEAAATTSRDPGCLNGSGCGSEWPVFRWEFTDASDEDGNGEADLGQTWSRPLVAFVKVAGETDPRMVAFFGGGYSPYGLDSGNPITGNFLYALDVETGKILYKYPTAGMVPGDVAGLDLNLDGFLEALYWGDTAGNLYKLDLTADGGEAMLDTVTGRIDNWQPQILFSDGSGQPFFMQPSLVPVSFNADGSAVIAIAIGTGNRDDILSHNNVPNRFYVIVDRPHTDGNGHPTPITENDLVGFNLTTPADQASNYLMGSTGYGWYLELDDGDLTTPAWEKVNTPALILNQYVIFSTFTPSETTVVTDQSGTTICKRGGSARTYSIFLYNGNPEPGKERFVQHESQTALATKPVVYVGADGKIHVIQALDNLKINEPVAAAAVPVRIMSWKEQ